MGRTVLGVMESLEKVCDEGVMEDVRYLKRVIDMMVWDLNAMDRAFEATGDMVWQDNPLTKVEYRHYDEDAMDFVREVRKVVPTKGGGGVSGE